MYAGDAAEREHRGSSLKTFHYPVTHIYAFIFLPSQGDVLVHLIETAQEELAKPTREISTTRLQVWARDMSTSIYTELLLIIYL